VGELVFYWCDEEPTRDELSIIVSERDKYNTGRAYKERVKLWRRSDVFPQKRGGRWGYSMVEDTGSILDFFKGLSEKTPRLTWHLQLSDRTVVLKAGELRTF